MEANKLFRILMSIIKLSNRFDLERLDEALSVAGFSSAEVTEFCAMPMSDLLKLNVGQVIEMSKAIDKLK